MSIESHMRDVKGERNADSKSDCACMYLYVGFVVVGDVSEKLTCPTSLLRSFAPSRVEPPSRLPNPVADASQLREAAFEASTKTAYLVAAPARACLRPGFAIGRAKCLRLCWAPRSSRAPFDCQYANISSARSIAVNTVQAG